MVYEKSAKGYSEFTTQKRTLSVRERQVLLLINGVRDLDELEKFFKKELLHDTLQKLEQNGFIVRFEADGKSLTASKAPTSTQAPTAALHKSAADDGIPLTSSVNNNPFTFTARSFLDTGAFAAALDVTVMINVKPILIEATDDYLGLMGRNLKERIQACQDETELRNCISSWHMAMRESKLGRESTSFLMEQIHQVLENAPVANAGLEDTPYVEPEWATRTTRQIALSA